MRMKLLAVLLLAVTLVLGGCGGGGGGDHAPVLVTTDIFSDPIYNGDIVRNSFTGGFTVMQGYTESVFAGIDPVNSDEYRAFLDFPLGKIPPNAIIDSALLDIFINSISPQPLPGTIPIRIDLISFQPPTLVAEDFSRTLQPALSTTTITPPISQSDFGRHVLVDVTALMAEAQRQRLTSFQVRVSLAGSAVAPGLIEINDTTGVNRGTLSPLLQVTYF